MAVHELQYIDEAWGILPKSLSVVDTVEGQKLYSSEALRKKFVMAIANQKILAPVTEKINNLIERQIVIPCFASGNVIRLIGHKFFSDQMSKAILGFYFNKKNKVYVMLDNHVKFLFFMSNKNLSSLTMHELMHYASWNLRLSFFNLHKDTFRTFWRYFYKLQLDLNLPNNYIDAFVVHMLKSFEYPLNPSKNFLVNFANLMFEAFKVGIPDEDRREKEISHILATVKLYVTDPNSFIRHLSSGNSVVVGVVRNLQKAYKSLKIRSPNTLAIQEFIFPSEVICIQSQNRPNSKHYATIKAL